MQTVAKPTGIDSFLGEHIKFEETKREFEGILRGKSAEQVNDNGKYDLSALPNAEQVQAHAKWREGRIYNYEKENHELEKKFETSPTPEYTVRYERVPLFELFGPWFMRDRWSVYKGESRLETFSKFQHADRIRNNYLMEW